MFIWKVIAITLVLSGFVGAQQPSPYAGEPKREIKALSFQEIQDLLEGKGMGYARAAELNRYPGPAHVLQLRDDLRITPEQKAETDRIHATMEAAAKSLGAALVTKERELDRLFAAAEIESNGLRLLLLDIGRLQAEIRNMHLQAHLQQRTVLTPAQVAMYDRLRGYVRDAASPNAPGEHRHF